MFGHSLGAAMAAVCALHVVNEELWTGEKIKLVTYGEPRIGDLDFAIQHDAEVPFLLRQNTVGDPFVVCERADDDSCSNRQLDLVFSDHDYYYNVGVNGWGKSRLPWGIASPTVLSQNSQTGQ